MIRPRHSNRAVGHNYDRIEANLCCPKESLSYSTKRCEQIHQYVHADSAVNPTSGDQNVSRPPYLEGKKKEREEENQLLQSVSHTRTEGFAGELLSKRSTLVIVALMLGTRAAPET